MLMMLDGLSGHAAEAACIFCILGRLHAVSEEEKNTPFRTPDETYTTVGEGGLGQYVHETSKSNNGCILSTTRQQPVKLYFCFRSNMLCGPPAKDLATASAERRQAAKETKEGSMVSAIHDNRHCLSMLCGPAAKDLALFLA